MLSMATVEIYIERLAAAHRMLMRRLAQDNGLQMVQIEIVQYLLLCNRYSDTAQALSEYLGQTKGSLSQSLAHLEDLSLIKRVQDKNDKRIYHIELTVKGSNLARKFQEQIELSEDSKELSNVLKKVLNHFQRQNNLKSFGICSTCKYNTDIGQNKFKCGLTEELLSSSDVELICREHE